MFNEFWCQTKDNHFVQYLQLLENHELLSEGWTNRKASSRDGESWRRPVTTVWWIRVVLSSTDIHYSVTIPSMSKNVLPIGNTYIKNPVKDFLTASCALSTMKNSILVRCPHASYIEIVKLSGVPKNVSLSHKTFFGTPDNLWNRYKSCTLNVFLYKTKFYHLVWYLQLLQNYLNHELSSVPKKVFWDKDMFFGTPDIM